MTAIDYRIGNARQSTARQMHQINTIVKFLFFQIKAPFLYSIIFRSTSVFKCIHVGFFYFGIHQIKHILIWHFIYLTFPDQ